MNRTISTTWEVWGYEVWGNNEDGYDVNDRYLIVRAQTIRLKVQTYNPGTPSAFQAAEPSDYQIKRALGVSCAIDTDGDDTHIYVTRASDGYPLGQLICTSHAALSPIREKEVTP